MYIGSIDQGTTSTRFIIFDKQGQIISLAQKEHAQLYPQPGWVEHNPDEIWCNTKEVIQKALKQANLTPKDLIAVGITNQRETTVMWNRYTGKPYYNALVWQDTRTSTLVTELSAEGGPDRFREQTGLPLATYFSSLKIKWLLKNVATLEKDALKGEVLFGTMDTYLLWHLTGGMKGGLHLTDVTNASRTQLMDLRTLQWDEGLLETFGIPRSILPEIRSSSEVYATAKGVLEGVPLAGVLGDQQAALVGQTCFRPGEAKNTYGTGCFMLLNTGDSLTQSTHGLVTTVAYQLGNQPVQYALEGSVAIAGALVQWLRDNLGLIEKSSDIETLARTVEDNGGCYFVPAFSGLYAPYWRSDARGVVAGLTRFVTKGHLGRAALEATAFQTLEILEAMEKDAGVRLSELRVDGGMTVNELLMQFQSDLLNVPVVRPTMIETTALGAAYAAGLAVGYWKDLDDLRQNWGIEKTWKPQMARAKRNAMYRSWRKAVRRSFGWEE
ncbi:glycerol kinase [Siphonobacter sp. BAB-5385]|uniref:glycerol kinase GlpK n=1 Tax=unclassified Siphonobacter TaxID=2635712 RepID=UPI000B9E7B37|nr:MULTISPECIES: glycerol kinase GlpK [unclassified Siphonobacter]OZI07507.1 glycerol kinase [Siphonobacter sp. BAB-5385]PMD98408.1 glycerol kinase [Siphonobacter sp. BAB-5405]